MSIADNLQLINNSLPSQVTLVAVSKTKPVSDLMQAYDAGQRIFGENRVEELVEKHPAMPQDVEWHMIGHLQSKKTRNIASFVSMIHGVDSEKLLGEINKQATKHDRVIDCLLQFHIASESTKYGFDFQEVEGLLSTGILNNLAYVNVRGVMGMATFTDNLDQVREEFRTLRGIFDQLRTSFFADKTDFDQISMGMSGDYQIAIEEGSTMVRVGSSIFGARNYAKL